MKLALNQIEAADAVGVSVNTFVEHVRPYVKSIHIGGVRRFPVTELERWLARNAQ